MKDPEILLVMPATREGLERGKQALERLTGSSTPATSGAPTSTKTAGQAVYEQSGHGSRTRAALKLLPDNQADAITPEELGARMNPPLSKASARATILNVRRIEKHLKDTGVIDREVVHADFSQYDAEGAGRYYVSPEDKAAIDQL